MEKRIVVAVDGLAGSGKTTISRVLAEKLGFAHLNTGILYRAAGFLALLHNIDLTRGKTAAEFLKQHQIKLVLSENNSSIVLIDGVDAGDKLLQPPVSEATSKISVFPEVRELLVSPQREAFAGYNLVAEGRDMGTVIFPDADIKFFIEAGVNLRVERRLEQLGHDLKNLPPERLNSLKKDIEIEVIERDKRDSERAIAPTVAARDAILIDNSSQTLTEVVQSMYDAVADRGLICKRQ